MVCDVVPIASSKPIIVQLIETSLVSEKPSVVSSSVFEQPLMTPLDSLARDLSLFLEEREPVSLRPFLTVFQHLVSGRMLTRAYTLAQRAGIM